MPALAAVGDLIRVRVEPAVARLPQKPRLRVEQHLRLRRAAAPLAELGRIPRARVQDPRVQRMQRAADHPDQSRSAIGSGGPITRRASRAVGRPRRSTPRERIEQRVERQPVVALRHDHRRAPVPGGRVAARPAAELDELVGRPAASASAGRRPPASSRTPPQGPRQPAGKHVRAPGEALPPDGRRLLRAPRRARSPEAA